MSPPRFAAVLRSRHFRSLWINQICLQFSYHMVNFTLLLSAWQLTGSNASTSLLMFTLTLPAILLGVAAGLVADTLDRRRVMILTNFLLIGAFTMFVLLPSTMLTLMLLAFFMSSVTQFFMPAEASAIPMIVEKKDLLVAQSLFSLTLNASFLLGYALAGPIIAVGGLTAPFLYAIMAVALGVWFIRSLPPLRAFVPRESLQYLVAHTHSEIREGYRFIRTHRFVSIPIAVLTVTQALVGIIASLIPGFMERVVGAPSTSASFLIMLPTGLGMVGGSILVKRLCDLWARRVIVARSIQSAGILLILIALAPPIIRVIANDTATADFARKLTSVLTLGSVLFFLSVLLGIAAVVTQVISMTVLQENTPNSIKGRVFATLNMAISGIAVVPILVAGRLADAIGILPVLSGLGVGILLLGIVATRYRFIARHVLPSG